MIRMNLLPPEEKAQQRAPIDFKLGEFALTRLFKGHPADKKAKK